jgi:hypothetical protein
MSLNHLTLPTHQDVGDVSETLEQMLVLLQKLADFQGLQMLGKLLLCLQTAHRKQLHAFALPVFDTN